MKKAILFLGVVLLVSACVDIKDPNAASFSGKFEKSNEDISVLAEVSQPELKSGQPTNLRFTVENKQPFALKNFQLNAFDICDFDCSGAVSWIEAEVKPNQTKTKTFTCRAPQVDFERQCNIQFRENYEAQLFQTYGIVILSESEFASGKSHTIPSSTQTQSPMKISASWSEKLPFVEKDNVYLTLDYSYTGDGIVDKLRGNEGNGNMLGDVSISVPAGLEVSLPLESNCADFSAVAVETPIKKLNLKRSLTFIEKKAKPSTCAFKTKASLPIETGTLGVDAHFAYQIDGSIGIKVRPK